MDVCPDIFASGDQTAGPNLIGEAPFEEPNGGKKIVRIGKRLAPLSKRAEAGI